MDRKIFIRQSLLAAFSVSTVGSVLRAGNNFTGDCETTNDILGPFYRENAPERSDLTFAGLEGNEITIKGKVYGKDCVTAVKGAVIEIWHCNTKGEYDNNTSDFKHRGTQKTNEKGEYSFKTILPGKYLNGALYRPSHIHFRITATGKKELISQIYFSGDPHIDKDPWASNKSAKERTLQIFPEDTNGNLVVEFPIYLSDSN
ncbi:MAG: twin-arginine translocation pathway signal protein [Bacteroidetes bacterium]|nr:twin-arginine translocation pathway signal protein [Bacteroidota bacterium]